MNFIVARVHGVEKLRITDKNSPHCQLNVG
jgi:hypothetical protein